MLLLPTTQRSVPPLTLHKGIVSAALGFPILLLTMSTTEEKLRVELNEAITAGDLDRTTLVLDKLSTIVSSPPPSDAVVLATEIGSLPIVKLLLSRGAGLPDAAVLEACTTAKIEFLQVFLDSGLWDIKLRFGSHLGDILTSTGHAAVIKWALDHGADPNKNRDGGYYYPLESAVSGNDLESAKLLISAGAHVKGTYALTIAAQKGLIAIISLLLESGADINEIPPDKYNGSPWRGTPLHEAAQEGHLRAVQLLLDHGADATLKDSDGKTALELARASNYVSVAEVLEGQLVKVVTAVSVS